MPAWMGGIITERAGPGGLVDPGFRTRIPERVLDSGRIFRAIDGLEDVYQTKGSGASPEMLRTEMGVLYTHDLQATLGTQETFVDAVSVSVDVGAASTTSTTTFSFQEIPDGSGRKAAHHRILGGAFTILTGGGNVEGFEFRAQPFGDPTEAPIALLPAADLVTITGLTTGADLPAAMRGLWGKRETDYIVRARSTATAGFTSVLRLLVMLVPDGVAVPV